MGAIRTRRLLGTVDFRGFLILAAVVLPVTVASFIGATVLDASWLRFVGLAALALLVLGHEAWRWRGAGRQWLVMLALLLTVVVVAFVVEKAQG